MSTLVTTASGSGRRSKIGNISARTLRCRLIDDRITLYDNRGRYPADPSIGIPFSDLEIRRPVIRSARKDAKDAEEQKL